MKSKIVISMLVIVVVIAASLGATFAWFTDESEAIENVFTAGTVIISAEEEITAGGETMENWNPGDCATKEFTIKNEGSKGIKLRGIIETQWYEYDEADEEWVEWTPSGDDAVRVSLTPDTQAWTEDPADPGIWYYDQTIDGKVDGQDAPEVELILEVCLDGPEADNQYQGKRFILTAKFQAIQQSHEGEWNWDEFDTYNQVASLRR